jgi:hypothetical protein
MNNLHDNLLKFTKFPKNSILTVPTPLLIEKSRKNLTLQKLLNFKVFYLFSCLEPKKCFKFTSTKLPDKLSIVEIAQSWKIHYGKSKNQRFKILGFPTITRSTEKERNIKRILK